MPPDAAKTSGPTETIPRPAHLSDHLSNERTYLAYLRTAVSLMGLGIAINRFSLYLIQSREAPSSSGLRASLVESERMGIGMVLIGLGLLVWGAVHYTRILHQIDDQNFRPHPRSIWILTTLVMICGLTGAVWLVL